MTNNNRRKRGTIGTIGAIIIFILILLIMTLFMPFSFAPKSKSRNERYEYVMRDIFKDKDAKVTDIAMLGAHDAFTHNLSYTSIADSNDQDIVTNKVTGIIAKGLAVRFSKAQNASAKSLLYSGVRYIDVRVTKMGDTYYTSHKYVSDTLESYLKETIDFLDSHKGEFIIFDIQHFRTENGLNRELSSSEFSELFDYMETIKTESGKSIFDFAFYDSSTDEIKDLTYTKVTNNKESAGVIILSKKHPSNKVYYRDNDALYKHEADYYENIRSFWHQTNSNKEMINGIEYEYNYIIENNVKGMFVVNQAQKTALIASAKIIKSLFGWSLLDMANGFNAKLIKDEERFKRWLKAMPIFMVDNVTSKMGNFNALANKYIMEYNESL